MVTGPSSTSTTSVDFRNAVELDIDKVSVAEEYLDRLRRRGLPAIFDEKHLALSLTLRPRIVSAMVENPDRYYRRFSIRKRSGGAREVAAPLPSLLHVQRWINTRILKRIRIDQDAHAYQSGKSIRTHASAHLRSRVIYKVDLKDFFHSVALYDVSQIFEMIGYNNKVSYYLSRLCTLNERLPQGAATSPALSNIVFRPIDISLRDYATDNNLVYSRYDDDLCFSGEYINVSEIKGIRGLIEKSQFSVNESKCRLEVSSARRVICGVSISSGKMLPTRDFRRETRRDVFELRRISSPGGLVEFVKNDPFRIDRILGRLYFWSSFDTSSEFVVNAIRDVKSLLKRFR